MRRTFIVFKFIKAISKNIVKKSSKLKTPCLNSTLYFMVKHK